MFGYIKPMTSELKVKEHELYKAVYCGLCLEMGKCVGQLSRFTLSYDILFLALVRAALLDEPIHLEKGTCIAHPLKKRNHAFIPDTLSYCAKVSAILTHFNIVDDQKDSRGFASLRANMLSPAAKSFMKRADLPLLADELKKYLTELDELEKGDGGIDRNAECFGRLLAAVFAYNIKDEKLFDIACRIGMHTGKWIYMIDAADDFEKDRKKGEYNPLSGFEALPREELSVAATLELSSAYDALCEAVISNEPLCSIIKNILTLGMPEVQDRILGEKK